MYYLFIFHFMMILAIKSLDKLNDHIVQFIFSPAGSSSDLDLSACNQQTLRSSMILLRKLLQDSQDRFRTMVENNTKLGQ